MTKLRWGILGAANIARKNWKAIFHSGNNTVVAVAARDIVRAEQFIRECQAQVAYDPIPKALNSYEQLLASPEVDAVYIPLPTALRKEWVIRAAQAGKHVLCEKPCAMNAADLREMIEACVQHRVQFMDGVMFMHSPRLAAVETILTDAHRIGSIRRVELAFCFAANAGFASNIRVQSELEPAGCLGDLGWYCLRMSLFAQRWQLPQQVVGRILTPAADGKTPVAFSGELLFSDQSSAGFFCSFTVESQQWVSVMGSKGTLRISDFVHPRNSFEPAYEINGAEHRVAAPPGISVPVDPAAIFQAGHSTAQDTRMFQNFAAQIQSKVLHQAWPEIALKTQLVLDACLQSARNQSQPVDVVSG